MRYLAVVLLFGIVCRVSCSPNFQEIGGKHYFIENDHKLNWFDARDKCRSMDAHLVSIQNYGELNAITNHLSSCKSYWVDIRDVDSNNYFTSDTSGREAPFLHWGYDEPGCQGDCVKLRANSHNMETRYCNQWNHYICEANSRPVSNPVTAAPIVHHPKPTKYNIVDLHLYKKK